MSVALEPGGAGETGEQPWRPRAIWRFELPITDRHDIEMPRHSLVIAVAASRHDRQGLELWAAVDPAQERVPRTFLVVGTGQPIVEEALSYHGMAQTHGGALVWHVLEATS